MWEHLAGARLVLVPNVLNFTDTLIESTLITGDLSLQPCHLSLKLVAFLAECLLEAAPLSHNLFEFQTISWFLVALLLQEFVSTRKFFDVLAPLEVLPLDILEVCDHFHNVC